MGIDFYHEEGYTLHVKIKRVTTNRTITEEEFLRLKKIKPFSTFRQDSKGINFGMIFGMSFKKFSSSTLETSWSYERVQEFVKERHLEDIVKEMQEKYSNIDSKLWSYYAVAKFIRDNFFDTYKGLMKRIKRNEELGKTVGYIRSFHGGIRRVPLLSLATNPDTGRYRRDENLKEASGLVNICANSTIQTDESAVVAIAALKWNSGDNECKASVETIGFVHDSLDAYVDKDRILEVIPKLKEVFEIEEKWQQGVKFLIDIQIVDLENKDHYYKKGVDFEKFLEEYSDTK